MKKINLFLLILIFSQLSFVKYKQKNISYEGLSCNSIKYETFGIPKDKYKEIFSDGEKVTPEEKFYLYSNYYETSPKIFKAHATWYGNDIQAIGELLQYGLWLRQQMWRGWVLIASGKHGYHPEIKDDLYKFIKNYYSYKDANDYLLFEQRSSVYFYFADGGNDRLNRDSEDQPIPVPYEDLNPKQKRVFDLTVTQAYKMERRFFTTIELQSKMTEQEALDSGKYISVVSGKTINDFGRRYMIYKCIDSKLDFIGVVIVGGEAKRSDWTGIGNITTPTFAWNYAPLSIREANGEHWGFDFPLSLYKYFGGTTGATTEPIIAIDPDL